GSPAGSRSTMERTAPGEVALGVRALRDTVTAQESWVYNCVRCLTVWQEDYEVHHTDDGHGGDAVTYFKGGGRCLAPVSGHTRANCGRGAVRSRPAPWAKPESVRPAPRRNDLELVFRLRRLHAY